MFPLLQIPFTLSIIQCERFKYNFHPLCISFHLQTSLIFLYYECGIVGGFYICDMWWLEVNFQLQFPNYNISQFRVHRNFTLFCLHLNVRAGWVVMTWNVSERTEPDFALRYQISECAVSNLFRYSGKLRHMNKYGTWMSIWHLHIL
jgi:hypothetical protein